MIHGEVIPGIGHALLHAEGNAAAVFVDFEDHDLDFVAQLDDLRRVDVLVRPVHFRDVHEAFDTLLDLDESAVVGEVGGLAKEARALRIAAGNADPGVFAKLLQTQRDAVFVLVELEHHGLHLVADGQHLGGMAHAPPGKIGDVQQTIDAAEIDESAVIGDVLDDALDGAAFLEVGEQRLAFFAHAGFEHRAARDDDVVAFAVELDDLELEGFAFVWRGVLDRAHVHQGTRQKGAHAVGHDGEAALDLAGDRAGDERAVVQGEFQRVPGGDALGALAREAGFAKTVLQLFDGDLDEIADDDFDFARVAQELSAIDVAFGFEPGVDDHEILIDAHDLRGDDLALAHFLAREAGLKKLGKTFLHSGGGIG